MYFFYPLNFLECKHIIIKQLWKENHKTDQIAFVQSIFFGYLFHISPSAQ